MKQAMCNIELTMPSHREASAWNEKLIGDINAIRKICFKALPLRMPLANE